MFFCAVYVKKHIFTGLWKFSAAVVPFFWSPTSIFVNFLKPSPLRNMPKGKKAVKAQYLSVPQHSKTSRAIDLATSDGHSSRMALRYDSL